MSKYVVKIIILFFLFLAIGNFTSGAQIITPSNTQRIYTLKQLIAIIQRKEKVAFSYSPYLLKEVTIAMPAENITLDTLKIVLKNQTFLKINEIGNNIITISKKKLPITTCGIVVSASSKEPIDDVLITLSNSNKKNSTAVDGRYKLICKSSDTLFFSAHGFDDFSIPIPQQNQVLCDTITLIPKVNRLETVMIKEYLAHGISKIKDASLLIESKKLGLLPGLVEPDVLQSIQSLPGISSPTNDVAGIYVRGGTPDQNLMLWDGIKIYQSGHFYDQISSYNPYITDKIVVYRGGTSVKYGDRLAGVIDIRSDTELFDRLKGGAGLNMTTADAYLKIPLSKKIGVLLAGRRSITDLYKGFTFDNLGKKVFQNSRFQNKELPGTSYPELPEESIISFSDFNFKALWEPSKKNRFQLSSIYVQNSLKNPVLPVPRITNVSIGDRHISRNLGIGLSWQRTGTNERIQKSNFYYSKNQSDYLLSILDQQSSLEENKNNSKYNGITDIGFEYSLQLPLKKYLKLLTGYQYVYNEVNNQYIFDTETQGVQLELTNFKSLNQHILYTEFQVRGKTNYANLGLRSYFISNDLPIFIEPRLYTSQRLTNSLFLTASAELKNQRLHNYKYGNDLYSSQSLGGYLPVNDNLWSLSGIFEDNLSPIVRSQQYTLGTLIKERSWQIDLEFYYKKIKDMHLFQTAQGRAIEQVIPYDIGNLAYKWPTMQQELYGMDLLIKKNIKNYNAWFSYTLSKSNSFVPQFSEASYPSSFDQRHVLNISNTYSFSKIQIGLNWIYTTGKPYTSIISNPNRQFSRTIGPNGINGNRYPDFHKLDGSILYNFKPSSNKFIKSKIGIAIRNIYDRQVTISETVQFSQNGPPVIQPKKSLGTTIDCVLRVEF